MRVREIEPYSAIADIYDKIYGSGVLGCLIRFQSVLRNLNWLAKTVLDVGCRTGSFALANSFIGMRVVGVDKSKALLKVAKRRVRCQLVKWICQDMRNLDIPLHFDTAVSNLDSVNYLLDFLDVKNTFQGIANHLVSGGFFLFDAVTPEQIRRYSGSIKLNFGRTCVLTSLATIDTLKAIQEMRIRVIDLTKSSSYMTEEIHRQRGYSYKQMYSFLSEIGFDVIDAIEVEKFQESENFLASTRLYYVAQLRERK